MQERVIEERRLARPVFRVPERRTGFDRRRVDLLTRMRESRIAPAVLIGGIVAMSLADWLLTLQALQFGASEGNPVLAALMGVHPALAPGFKTLMTLLVAWVMWRNRRYRAVLAVSVAAFIGYWLLLAYHIGGLMGIGAI